MPAQAGDKGCLPMDGNCTRPSPLVLLNIPPAAGSRSTSIVVARTRGRMRWLFGVVLILGGFLTGAHLVHRLASPVIYTDDFAEDYAAAKALRAGVSPYTLPVSTLIRSYIPESTGLTDRPYATPHPPLLAVLVLPLTAVPYRTARELWLELECVWLVALVRLVFHRSWLPSLAIAVALIAWPPITLELRYGQWTLLLALLTLGAWKGRSAPAGAGGVLGLAVALKFFPAVLLGVFVLRRAWRTVAWAIASAGAFALAPLAIAPGLLSGYAAAGGPFARALLPCFANYSAIGAAVRFVQSAAVAGVPPLVAAPASAPLLVLCAVAALLLVAADTTRHSEGDAAYAVALTAAVLLAPLAWQYYLCLLLWPIVVLAGELKRQGWPRPAVRAGFAAVVLLSVPQQIVSLAAEAAASAWAPLGALVLLALPAGPLLLLALLVRCSSRPSARSQLASSPSETTAMAATSLGAEVGASA